MRTHLTTTIAGAVLTTLLFVFSAFARDHSALNGTWTMLPANVLKVTTTESGAVTLESYSLAANGAMLVSVERPGHKPITLVFEHQ